LAAERARLLIEAGTAKGGIHHQTSRRGIIPEKAEPRPSPPTTPVAPAERTAEPAPDGSNICDLVRRVGSRYPSGTFVLSFVGCG
jgi:hypothetical protein